MGISYSLSVGASLLVVGFSPLVSRCLRLCWVAFAMSPVVFRRAELLGSSLLRCLWLCGCAGAKRCLSHLFETCVFDCLYLSEGRLVFLNTWLLYF